MFMRQNILRYISYALIIAVTVYSVFFLKVEITRYRIFQELWNLGHIVLFIALYYIVYRKLLNQLKLPIITEFFIIIFSSLLVGFCIEILQTYTGRDKSNYDILLDIVGAVIAFILFSRIFSESSNKVQALFTTLVFTLTVVSLYPMAINITDAINQRLDFPRLLTNDSKNELTRFKKGNVELDIIEKDITTTRKKVLSVTFKPAQYATISLESFNKDWTLYSYLNVSIYNPGQTSSVIILRVHDRTHETNGFNFKDRFNTRVKLNSGWNKLSIRLSDIKDSPVSREMDMDEVVGFMLFKMNSRITETLFISQIQLVK